MIDAFEPSSESKISLITFGATDESQFPIFRQNLIFEFD